MASPPLRHNTKKNRTKPKAPPIVTGKARPLYVARTDVLTAARNRMRWIFDEFDGNVSVSNSGGKDSTVVLELAAEVARENGVKLKVVWLDQEAEFGSTVDYQRYIMYERDDIDFHWYQIPFKLFNGTSHDANWLNVWGEGEEWVRPKEPNSIHENTFLDRNGQPIDRFKPLLGAMNKETGGAILTGMRAEESPGRRIFMVSNPCYKWVTWGSRVEGNSSARMFHPIYDWSYRDIWKTIYDNDWRYNAMYDHMYRYGIPTRQMRVSSYSHTQALGALMYLQETEPETWEAATRRLAGLSTQAHVGNNSKMVDGLPYMFRDWEEYMHHLIDNLVTDPEAQDKFRHMYTSICTSFPHADTETVAENVIISVMLNDWTWTTINQFVMNLRRDKRRQNEYDQMDREGANA